MKHELAKLLLDAVNACNLIVEFTAEKSIADYSSNPLVRSAVERQFEILGEAFSRLDRLEPSFRAKFPAIGSIIGMRNRIIHGYDSVDDEIIWDAVKTHIPPLVEWLHGFDL